MVVETHEHAAVALSHRAFVDHALGAAIHPDWGTLAYPDEYGNARILLFLRPAHVLDTFFNTVGQRAGGGLLGLKSKTADALVLNKAKAALGGRLRHVVCGGSRLSPDTARFFIGLGVLVMEGYGATEMAGPLTCTPPSYLMPGATGIPYPGATVKIADDGEVLAKGPACSPGTGASLSTRLP